MLREYCGVFGIYDNDNLDIVEETYLALLSLQHRGQAGAGLAVNKNGEIKCIKDVGLVNEALNQKDLEKLPQGNISVGHIRNVRYDLIDINVDRAAAQPLVIRYINGSLAIAHNGSLTNVAKLKKELELGGAIFQAGCDAEIISYIVASQRLVSATIEEAVERTMDKLKGAFSVVMMSPSKLIGMRDPNGFRPLCIGKLKNSYIFASESCAIESLGGTFIRDVRPGEIVVADEDGLHSYTKNCKENTSMCIFEYVYFSRPDSVLDNISVYQARRKAGALLAQEHPVEADIVCGVPDSGIPGAMGYAAESGIPYEIAFIKNKYTGRLFIQQEGKRRNRTKRIRLNVLSANVKDKRVVVVDDSLIRGTTSANIIKMLKDAGAKEVHLRVSSPPFTNLCYYGTDIKDKDKLIASHKSIEEIREEIGADSLGYLSLEGLKKTVEGSTVGVCTGCFTGEYPTEISKEIPVDRYAEKLSY